MDLAGIAAWFFKKAENRNDFRRARINHAVAEAAYHVPASPAFPSTVESDADSGI